MKEKKKIAVVAFGGNAMLQGGDYDDQINHMTGFLEPVIQLIKSNYHVVITHGNGPQVGALMSAAPTTPLWRHVRSTQSEIGTIIMKALENLLREHDLQKHCVLHNSLVMVDEHDPAFQNPTKYVGPEYTNEDDIKNIASTVGYSYKKNAKGFYRIVVPSPFPRRVLIEDYCFDTWFCSNTIPIVCGGGGVGITIKKGKFQEQNVVLDKDMSAACLAGQIGADLLLILMEAPCIFDMRGRNMEDLKKILKFDSKEFDTYVKTWLVNHDETAPKPVYRVNWNDARLILKSLEEGSVHPKLLAAITFIEGGGKMAVLTNTYNFGERFERDFKHITDYGTIVF